MDRKPIEDRTFGTLAWDDTLDYWVSSVLIPGVGPIPISVDTDEDEDITPDIALDNARRAYLALRAREPAARAFAAEVLLDVYNREWNQGDPIDEDAFMEQLALEDISFHPNGSAELFYDAADLFLGRTIIVTLDEESQFDDVEIGG